MGHGMGWNVEQYAYDTECETLFENEEFGFTVSLPEGIGWSAVSDCWEDNYDGMLEKDLLRQEDGTADLPAEGNPYHVILSGRLCGMDLYEYNYFIN